MLIDNGMKNSSPKALNKNMANSDRVYDSMQMELNR